MSEQLSGPKYWAITATLEREIRSGSLPPGQRIPGEHELAERFGVSRGTVRQALALLTRRRLIRTHAGSGSYVEFAGDRLEWSLGLSRALAKHGAQVVTRVIRLAQVTLPELAERTKAPSERFVALDRIRMLDGHVPVALERSRIPLAAATAALLERDYTRQSLTAALRECGCVPAAAEQWVRVHRLTAEEAGLFGRPGGEPYLLLRRVLRSSAGELVEYVESLLDPDRFDLYVEFDPRGS